MPQAQDLQLLFLPTPCESWPSVEPLPPIPGFDIFIVSTNTIALCFGICVAQWLRHASCMNIRSGEEKRYRIQSSSEIEKHFRIDCNYHTDQSQNSYPLQIKLYWLLYSSWRFCHHTTFYIRHHIDPISDVQTLIDCARHRVCTRS